jgi:epoxyqueuosine reductase QueG
MDSDGRIYSTTQSLKNYVSSYIASKGCEESMVGFADIEQIEELYNLDSTYPRAVAFLVPLSRRVLAQLAHPYSGALYEQYSELVEILDDTSKAVVKCIEAMGYAAYGRPTYDLHSRQCHFRPNLNETLNHKPGDFISHREVAMHAGLGWMGKCGHIVTKPYGSAVLLNSVLTDMPLKCNSGVFLSRCGRCNECLYVCQVAEDSASKVSYVDESDDAQRATRINQEVQKAMERQHQNATGGETDSAKSVASSSRGSAFDSVVFAGEGQGFSEDALCGACVYSCPYTKAYLFRTAISNN